MHALKEVELGEVAGGSGNYEVGPASVMDVFNAETGIDFGPDFSQDLQHSIS